MFSKSNKNTNGLVIRYVNCVVLAKRRSSSRSTLPVHLSVRHAFTSVEIAKISKHQEGWCADQSCSTSAGNAPAQNTSTINHF